MLAKIIAFLAFTSVAAFLLKEVQDDSHAAALEREVAGQLDALRAYLFKS